MEGKKIMTIGITRNHHQVPTSQATGVLPRLPLSVRHRAHRGIRMGGVEC